HQVLRISGFKNSQQGRKHYEPFRREAQRIPGVTHVTGSTLSFFGSEGLKAPLALGDTADVTATALPVDSTFRETLGIDLIRGRSLSAPQTTDGTGVLINEALEDALGWTAPVGRTLRIRESSVFGTLANSATILGVVENFHTRSMRHRVRPLILAPNTVLGGGVGSIYVRIEEGRLSANLDALRTTPISPSSTASSMKW
ncbi:MAG: ABC transporter permease, partial [Salinibacter sp.]